ncbi:MAG: hypothetical protein KDD70_11395 [Bdellovibrionales bacterium]|nr:hypothetical protein [Bdellovibrionales bacterium]
MKPIYLSAVGYAQPENLLSDWDGMPKPAVSFPVPTQHTALKLDYLRETKNSDPFQVVPGLAETPTSLAERASRAALARAGISAEELGLIFGAGSTPLETTPVESQRVGKALQVKIPAFDVNAGGADLALHLETLSAWKSEKVPQYTLSVSSHISTSRLPFEEGTECCFLFGDAAGVAVVGKERGRYRVDAAVARIFPSLAQRFTIDLYGFLRFDSSIEEEVFIPQLQKLVSDCRTLISGDAIYLESQLTPPSHLKLREALKGPSWRSFWSETGNTLGAAPALSLARLEEEAQLQGKDSVDAEQIVLLQCGVGLSVGVVVLSREE